MAYEPIPPYIKSFLPQLPGGEAQYLEQELKRLEAAIRALIDAIEELRAKVP